ncbi:MAG TPA: hypothetical protein VFO10_08620 [Oligoflexus sp.]|uniref:hypothetical protein n=1 Tax=Oligoflexus sp. TaxID=1971216 RepID=UPI002D7EBB2A|nr:hypothetical protein [Oligoflexus sp.]HET9237301.1 hypothetical protein [Oligoflexus sp.]
MRKPHTTLLQAAKAFTIMDLQTRGPICLMLTLLALTHVACGRSSGKGRNTSVPDRYFVLGDPMVMLDGTAGEKQSFLTTSSLIDFNDYTLAGFTVFAPKVDTSTIDTIDSQEELEDQNSTNDSQLDSELSLYRFQKDGSKYLYKAEGAAFVDYPVLEFIELDGRWELTALNADAAVVEHYSLSADKRVFSILISDSDELGNYLAALTFTRVDGEQKPLPRLNNSYQYLGGTGVAIGWDQTVKISVCGALSLTDQTIFKKSITDWSTATGDAEGTLGRLNYEVEFVTSSKPWNDVNQHCINLVKSYRLETQEDTAVFGVTIPVVDFQNFTIVDSQIFIFQDALNRFRESYLVTATHEMGHFWGLGHEFSRDARGRTLHPSIMGYEGVSSITSWDTDAILALYPR